MTENDMTPANYNYANFGDPEIVIVDDAEIAAQQASDEQDHVEEDPAYWEHYGFSPVEQGMYDDDPNPYHGDYFEDDGI